MFVCVSEGPLWGEEWGLRPAVSFRRRPGSLQLPTWFYTGWRWQELWRWGIAHTFAHWHQREDMSNSEWHWSFFYVSYSHTKALRRTVNFSPSHKHSSCSTWVREKGSQRNVRPDKAFLLEEVFATLFRNPSLIQIFLRPYGSKVLKSLEFVCLVH